MYLKALLFSFVMMVNCLTMNAQSNAVPFVGAEVFIEPGQTAAEIDTWFKVLKEQQFTVCRIRMFESYMKKADGIWNFSLFDNAFR